uniref:Sodefrin-like factor n=1 Tax=Panagrolaimus sp. ES5 TaxID=591445 RepID=A0AC34FM01_9BILA
MLVRDFLLSTLLFAVFCVSTLDATKKCNNFQLEKSVKNGEGKSNECSACTGYICKIGGKNILGSACTEDVKEICQQSWDESKLESIAAEKKYQSEKGKYFVFSCQEDSCNSVQWVTET